MVRQRWTALQSPAPSNTDGYLQVAGREGFQPSREFHTPYPLSRRVLSTTQPPPRQGEAVERFYLARLLSILSSRWKLPAVQARLRCGGLDARWPSERRPAPGASSGTRWLRAPSARSFFPFSTRSLSTNYVFSPPPAVHRRLTIRPTVSTASAG